MITFNARRLKLCYINGNSTDILLLTGDFQVNTVTVIYIAAVCVEQAFST